MYARTRRVCVLTSPQGRRTARENGCDGHASTVGTVCCSLHLVRNPHHLSNAYQICWGATPFLTEGLGVGARGLAAAGQGGGRDRRWSLFSSQKHTGVSPFTLLTEEVGRGFDTRGVKGGGLNRNNGGCEQKRGRFPASLTGDPQWAPRKGRGSLEPRKRVGELR